MSTQHKHGSIAFQPRARLLKLIGEELISDEVVAITELVKNAHDADATTVTISFRSVSTPGGEIRSSAPFTNPIAHWLSSPLAGLGTRKKTFTPVVSPPRPKN